MNVISLGFHDFSRLKHYSANWCDNNCGRACADVSRCAQFGYIHDNNANDDDVHDDDNDDDDVFSADITAAVRFVASIVGFIHCRVINAVVSSDASNFIVSFLIASLS